MTAAIRTPTLDPREPDLVAGRYRVDHALSHRADVSRLCATDLAGETPIPVLLVREPAAVPGELDSDDGSVWPSLAWEELLRMRCRHPGLPRLLGRCEDDNFVYLVLESPQGVTL